MLGSSTEGTSRWPFNMHGLNAPTHETPQFKEDLEAVTVELEVPSLPPVTLESVLRRRCSCRRFTSEPIKLSELGTILYGTYGVLNIIDLWGEFCGRPVPSGGGLYPLELYVLCQRVCGLEGVYHYLPLGHRLEAVRPDRLPSHLNSEMFLGQPYLANAAAVVQRSFAWLIYSMMVNQIHTIDPTVFKTEDDAPVIRLLQNSL